MNRKLLNGLMLLALTAGGVGTFTSCKDNDADFRNQVLVGEQDLAAQIEAIRNVTDEVFREKMADFVNNLIDEWWKENGHDKCDCEECGCNGGGSSDCDCEDCGFADFLDEWNKKWKGQIEAMYTAFQALSNPNFDYNNLTGDAKQIVDNLYKFINGEIQKEQWVADIWDGIEANADAIALVAELFDNYVNRASKITSINVNQTYNPIFGTVNLPVGLKTTVVATYLYNSDNERTFPMCIVGVDGPGTAGSSEYDEGAAMGLSNHPNLGTTLAALGQNMTFAAKTPYFTGYDGEEKDNNMGEIYLTVNPVNVNFDGVKVSLVNSQGEEILTNSNLALVSEDETVLDFGMTRTETNKNGFYRLPVNVTATADNWADFDQIAFDLKDKSGLFSAVKDAVKNHTISDIAHLGEMVYQQLDGFLPAYAVKASWTSKETTVTPIEDEEGNIIGWEKTEGEEVHNAVLSDYSIAATAARPLSYATAYGEGLTGRQLPIFDPVTEYFERYFNDFRKDINIDLGDLGGFDRISYEKINVVIDTENLQGYIDLEGMKVYPLKEMRDELTGEVYYVPDTTQEPVGVLGPDAKIIINWDPDSGVISTAQTLDMGQFVKALEDAINQQVGDQLDDIIASVNKMIDDINEQLGGLEASINDQIADIFDRFQNSLTGKLKYADKLVNLYNQLAKRINKLISDPNHYLQVTMAYNNNQTGMHHLSNNFNAPTKVTKVSGNMGLELFATSYNADIIVPSFQKYVAITAAWDENGNPVATSDVVALNTGDMLNKVVSGRTQRFGVPMENLKPGYKYEILYSSLDYHGYTSSMLYYIKVK